MAQKNHLCNQTRGGAHSPSSTLPSLPNQVLPLCIEEHQPGHIIAGTGLQDGAVGIGLPADGKDQLITPSTKGCAPQANPTHPRLLSCAGPSVRVHSKSLLGASGESAGCPL